MPTLSDLVDLLHGWYPPATADGWDAVGLVYGDPAANVGKVMFAVDPAPEVAHEAAEWGADLLVVHHPLFLKPVHGFAATAPKGRTLATLAGAGCALLTAHTNADRAVGGGVRGPRHRPRPDRAGAAGGRLGRPRDKLTVYVPVPEADGSAGRSPRPGPDGSVTTTRPPSRRRGEGRFRPLAGSSPTIGSVGTPRSSRRSGSRWCCREVVVRPSWRR
ncbi:Nif3-like dinuclear metal center hexameric protein [Nocardioides ungokensis]|uniref:Nif3-like dinuclear metal center hexameric protein n=1 Tax=Nocardioides ungokensis TaxID=1643322 RepID=UPI001FECBAEA|nr:Nif3-like dinuclear metal center hexameric protein [Nocardioides ungokensis]